MAGHSSGSSVMFKESLSVSLSTSVSLPNHSEESDNEVDDLKVHFGVQLSVYKVTPKH